MTLLSSIYFFIRSNKLVGRRRKPVFSNISTVLELSLYSRIFQKGDVYLIFKGKGYRFKKAFGPYFSIKTFQLFTHENGIVLFLGHKFEYFVFENDVFSKVEFHQHPSSIYKCFVKKNRIVLCAGKSIMSFIFKDNKFTMRHYPPIRHGIDGGILTFVDGTPYFVCCIHEKDSELTVVLINLSSGKQNSVLTLTKYHSFSSFKNRNCTIYITTSRNGSLIDTKIEIK
jgi:hypothetical protein